MNITEKRKEIARICANPFAFLEYVKIQEPGQLRADYILWEHLRDFFINLEKYNLIDLIKAKQIGISWALAIHALRKIMTVEGMNVLEISKGEKEAQSLLSKSKIVFNNLPDWIKEEPDYALEYDSSEKFGFKALHSRITAFSTTETAGLGETAGLVIHDESDFHEFYETNLSHTTATVADDPKRQLLSVSTVDKTKPDSYFKKHWKEAYAGLNGFKALFYGYDVRPGRDEAFYQRLVDANQSTPWVVEANYPRTAEEALSPQSAQSCFKKEVLDRLWEETINPEVRQGFIYILHPPRVGTQYVGGVDVGQGVGLDFSVTSIVGKSGVSSEVVAVIYSNKIDTASFAYETDALCREYFKPLLCIDNIGIGQAVVGKLVELGYPNLYYSDEKRTKVGWALTRPNKRELVSKLIQSIDDGSLITKFRPQVKELMEYQWINNYPEPTGSTHGDTVISLLLAHQMLPHVGIAQEASMYLDGQKLW